MPPKTSTPPKAGLERSTFFFKYIKCIQFLPKSNWIAICANSQWKARLQRWKKTRRKRGGKKPKNPQWRRQGDVILINFLRPPNPTQGQPANLPGCHHWFQSTVQALRVCSTFYQVFLLFWKHHWFKPPLLFKACCTFLPLHLGHWIQ